MKIAKIRFLKKHEEVSLPWWVNIFSEKIKKRYILKNQPYFIEKEEKDYLEVVICTEFNDETSDLWRGKINKILNELKNTGVAIIIAPKEGGIEEGILPIAKGDLIMAFFAFRAAGEALRRMGKSPGEAKFLICEGEGERAKIVLSGIENFINHLSFITEETDELEELREELFVERGLISEVGASLNSKILTEADVVIICTMRQISYEHILKRYAIIIDVVNNKAVYRQALSRRWDLFGFDGVYLKGEKEQKDAERVEAEFFCASQRFRELKQLLEEKNFYKYNPDENVSDNYSVFKKEIGLEKEIGYEKLRKLADELFNMYNVSGFSSLGSRVKVQNVKN